MNIEEDETLLKRSKDDQARLEILNNIRRPNVQFIRHAKQLNKRANELVEIFKKFRDVLKVSGLRSASIRTGNGFFINTAYFDINNFNRDYIIEVIDFDPVRNNMMVIGNEPPAPDTALHWFIYRGLPEVFGVINVHNSDVLASFQKSSYPTIDISEEAMDTNTALEVLKNVKNSEVTLIPKLGILVVGRSVMDAYEIFYSNLTKSSTHKED
ncbi:class II aldolase/adducin family protein [[Eubacterium] cellulosolvens]